MLERAKFARALVLDAPVGEIATRADECRTLRQAEVELSEGVYWFDGVDDGALVLHVPYGGTPGAATVAPVDELDDDHPLMAAWDWAEELWDRASVVLAPRFDINDAAVITTRFATCQILAPGTSCSTASVIFLRYRVVNTVHNLGVS